MRWLKWLQHWVKMGSTATIRNTQLSRTFSLSLVLEYLEDRITPASAAWGTGWRVVLDPGHGGTYPNNSDYAARGAGAPNRGTAGITSKVSEELLTLDIAVRVETALKQADSRFEVELTRDPIQLSWSTGDLDAKAWKSESDRANDAQAFKADFFVSLHFNGFPLGVRGTEALVKPDDTINQADDTTFGNILTKNTIEAFSAGVDRHVKSNDNFTFVLKDSDLGNTADYHPVISTLLEIESISSDENVDRFFNGGHSAFNPNNDPQQKQLETQHRDLIASHIASGIIEARETFFPTIDAAQTDISGLVSAPFTIQWNAHGNVAKDQIVYRPIDHVGLYLYQGQIPVDTSNYIKGGNQDGRLNSTAVNLPNSSLYSWSIPATLPGRSDYRIKVVAFDATGQRDYRFSNFFTVNPSGSVAAINSRLNAVTLAGNTLRIDNVVTNAAGTSMPSSAFRAYPNNP